MNKEYIKSIDEIIHSNVGKSKKTVSGFILYIMDEYKKNIQISEEIYKLYYSDLQSIEIMKEQGGNLSQSDKELLGKILNEIINQTIEGFSKNINSENIIKFSKFIVDLTKKGKEYKFGFISTNDTSADKKNPKKSIFTSGIFEEFEDTFKEYMKNNVSKEKLPEFLMNEWNEIYRNLLNLKNDTSLKPFIFDTFIFECIQKQFDSNKKNNMIINKQQTKLSDSNEIITKIMEYIKEQNEKTIIGLNGQQSSKNLSGSKNKLIAKNNPYDLITDILNMGNFDFSESKDFSELSEELKRDIENIVDKIIEENFKVFNDKSSLLELKGYLLLYVKTDLLKDLNNPEICEKYKLIEYNKDKYTLNLTSVVNIINDRSFYYNSTSKDMKIRDVFTVNEERLFIFNNDNENEENKETTAGKGDFDSSYYSPYSGILEVASATANKNKSIDHIIQYKIKKRFINSILHEMYSNEITNGENIISKLKDDMNNGHDSQKIEKLESLLKIFKSNNTDENMISYLIMTELEKEIKEDETKFQQKQNELLEMTKDSISFTKSFEEREKINIKMTEIAETLNKKRNRQELLKEASENGTKNVEMLNKAYKLKEITLREIIENEKIIFLNKNTEVEKPQFKSLPYEFNNLFKSILLINSANNIKPLFNFLTKKELISIMNETEIYFDKELFFNDKYLNIVQKRTLNGVFEDIKNLMIKGKKPSFLNNMINNLKENKEEFNNRNEDNEMTELVSMVIEEKDEYKKLFELFRYFEVNTNKDYFLPILNNILNTIINIEQESLNDSKKVENIVNFIEKLKSYNEFNNIEIENSIIQEKLKNTGNNKEYKDEYIL
jgi:hypothetical protein